jgi:hypothetical protein
MTLAMTAGTLSGILCAACHADVTTIPASAIDPYGSLRLETRSIVMSLAAPYDTLQLRATPYSLTGAQITTLGTPTYTVSDTSIVVSAAGVVTAKTRTSNSYVVVTLRDPDQNITHVDTAFITVTNDTAPSTLASFSLHTAPGDSAKLAINDGILASTKPLYVTATGTNDEDLSSLVHVRYRSSDTSIATVDPNRGFMKGFQIGTAVITAATTWYGVTKLSSIPIQIGNPIAFKWTAGVAPSLTNPDQHTLVYAPTDFTIGVGGVVSFLGNLEMSREGLEMDVIFDDSTAAQPAPFPDTKLRSPTGSGNVHLRPPVLLPGDTSLTDYIRACIPSIVTHQPPLLVNICGTTRYFPRAGRFTWHSDLWGQHGTITVTEP